MHYENVDPTFLCSIDAQMGGRTFVGRFLPPFCAFLAWALAKNAKKENVKQTASGLQYVIERPGSDEKPNATDRVEVHYSGKLLDGSEFDSSYKRNEPIVFGLNQVIPGWTEGLQLIGKGGKVKLFIPSKLGYGERGAGGVIPPNATLVFDVELLDIK